MVRSRRSTARLVDLESLEPGFSRVGGEAQVNHRFSAIALLDLIHRLKPLDRQVILLHLEGETAAFIAEVTGLNASNVSTKVHRIKNLLRKKYLEGAAHARS